jgi:hypothetical protein
MFVRLNKELGIGLFTAVVLALAACGAPTPTEPQVNVSFEEALLATIPQDIAPEDLDYHVFSPDGRRVAYIAQQGGKQFVVVGKDRGETFDKVSFPVFSPDGQRVAYIAQQGEAKYVVADGEKSEGFDEVWSLLFSPDGQTLAYRVQQGGQVVAVVGGNKGEAFDSVESIVFSADGKSVAYGAKSGNKWYVVVDGEKGTAYDFIGLDSIVFSPDGQTLGYLAKEGDKWFAVIGNERGPEFDTMGSKSQSFGPDGRAAYSGKIGKKWYTVVDGIKSAEYDAVWPPVFGPYGKTTAFVARQGKKKFVVVGDTAEPLQFDDMSSNSLLFGPDGRRVAYKAKQDNQWYAVLGEKKMGPYARVENLTFSPDGQTVAYHAEHGGKWYVVIGDDAIEPSEGILMSHIYIDSFKLTIRRAPTLVFGPDGDRLATVVLRGGKAFVLVSFLPEGNEVSAPYDLVGGMPVCLGGQLGFKQMGSQMSFDSPISVKMVTGQRTDVTGPQAVMFSPDGSQVAFGARDGRELWWKVLALD